MDAPQGDKINRKARIVANVVLVVLGLGSLAVWAYYLFHYVWPGGRQFASPSSILLFVCLPPTVALVLFASLRASASTRVALAMLCSSAMASMYAVEGLLNLWPSLLGDGSMSTWIEGASAEKKREVRELAAAYGITFDTRDLIEVLGEAQSRGIDAVPAVYPIALLEDQQNGPLKSVIRIEGAEILPLGGIANKITVLCNENGDYTVYQSDEHGFHNPKGIWSADRLEVAIVGDSFAHGFCVPSLQNFIALIRRRYPATLSLGMGGNGPILELATLKEFLPALRPRVVLWAYFEKNDLIELRKETNAPLLLQYLKTGFRQGLLSLQAAIDRELLAYVEKEKANALRRLRERKKQNKVLRLDSMVEFAKLNTLRKQLGLVPGEETIEGPASEADQSADMALFRAVLFQADAAVRAWGGSLYFLYLPQWERYAMPHLARQHRQRVLRAVADLRIPMIDIHTAFQSHADVLSLFPFRRSGHYNLEGNRLVAEAILKRLAHP